MHPVRLPLQDKEERAVEPHFSDGMYGSPFHRSGIKFRRCSAAVTAY